MAKNRLELQAELEDILGNLGYNWEWDLFNFETGIVQSNVYYQPPASIQMRYPAIVYSRSNIRNTFADNSVYVQRTAYMLTVIDKDPESEIVKSVSTLPLCRFDRHYTSDNLNHDVFTIYV